MTILDCAFVAYPASDLARTRAFYEGVLGLTCSLLEVHADEFWVEYEIGSTTLGLGNEPFLIPSGAGPQLVMEVKDLDDAVRHLKAHGVNFAHEGLESPRCRAAIMEDPAGNKLGLHARRRPAEASR